MAFVIYIFFMLLEKKHSLNDSHRLGSPGFRLLRGSHDIKLVERKGGTGLEGRVRLICSTGLAISAKSMGSSGLKCLFTY